MMMTSRRLILLNLFAFIFLTQFAFAQKQSFQLIGTVLEGNSKQPVEFATVMVKDAVSGQILSGNTTDAEGKFNIPLSTLQVTVEISFIGFVNQTFTDIKPTKGQLNLGTILLSENSETLDEVVVSAEKSSTEFKLDKRVFNVGKDLSSTGASVLEVLNNVPSVNVNIEGQISLRGSTGVQILINGKPSVLASDGGNKLGSITADMIDRIEVITNPSAKYEAEGTAGIINIVLKKEERKGINGSLSLNTGIPQNHSIGLSLNRRTEKFNLFSQLGFGYRELPQDQKTTNTNLENGLTILSEGTEYRNEYYYNFILGTDYHINKYNVLTLSGNYVYEVEQQPSRFDFVRPAFAGMDMASWYREESTEATNPKYQYELQYKKGFKNNKEHTLLASAIGALFSKDQSSDFENVNITGNEAAGSQQTSTNFKELRNTFNIDYTLPLPENITVEAGAQYELQDVSNDFAVSNQINGEWINDPGLTNVFEYDQNVLGLYGTGAYEGKKWGVKAGLRLENTDLSTRLVNTDEQNDNNFNNLFPSLHTSYKLTELLSVQAGYSKRIFRPRLWDLNPFFNIRNNYSVSVGNPELLPEFTDSYELTSIFAKGKVSTSLGLYYRYTTEVIERVSVFENNVNTVMPYNLGTKKITGVEFNGKYAPLNWLSFNGDINYSYFKREGTLESTSFDFNADQWTAKVTTKIKLPASIDFEVTTQYNSEVETIQGRNADILFADLGLRKKIMKGKAILNVSVRDVFASRIEERVVSQPDFYFYSRNLRGRFVTFGFSYGFGKGEAMEYLGQQHRR
jgi:outer membrane receptor protein involved in Fe transport